MALAVVVVMMVVAPASADPAGPTDYLSQVESIDPPSGAIAVSIVGGDSFVLLEQRAPVAVEVTGYQGEPYLRFLPDGTVERNDNSPARYLNDTRYGDDTEALPERADADADPDWQVVGNDGSYAWHDHRAHWMLESRPLALEPGDQILEGVIPLTVDGAEVEVTVTSVWQPSPSPLPALGGVIVGLAAVALGWRRRVDLGLVLAGGAAVALLVGAGQYLSLPPETAPPKTLWLLPGLALVAGIGALAVRWRPQTHLPLVFGGAVALFVFAVLRSDGLTRAVLPTHLPFWLDRGVTALALVVAAGTVVLSAIAISPLMAGPPRATGGEPT